MTKFSKGDTVSFRRSNFIKLDSVTIVAVNEKLEKDMKNQNELIQMYVIEYADGWTPTDISINQFGLDANKKYLFVKGK